MPRKLEDYGRIAHKTLKWYPEEYARPNGGVHWRAKKAFDAAADMWQLAAPDGEAGARKFREACGENILRLTPYDLDRDASPKERLRLVDAVKLIMVAGGHEHVRPPRAAGEVWVIATHPRSRFRGKLVALGEHEDGACYLLRLFDVLEAQPLIRAAHAEFGPVNVATGQPPTIDDLIALRAQQRAQIFAPPNVREPMEHAVARLELQRLIAEDDRILGTDFLVHGPKIADAYLSTSEVLDTRRLHDARELAREGKLPDAQPATDPSSELAPPAPPPKEKTPVQMEREENRAAIARLAEMQRELAEVGEKLEQIGGAS
jgi:hypothetical protein